MASPSNLAADIGRYLRNEAVQAVAPSVACRARKFARRQWRASRRPLAAMLAAVLLLAVSVGISRFWDRRQPLSAASTIPFTAFSGDQNAPSVAGTSAK
jgi:hypothetical protein